VLHRIEDAVLEGYGRDADHSKVAPACLKFANWPAAVDSHLAEACSSKGSSAQVRILPPGFAFLAGSEETFSAASFMSFGPYMAKLDSSRPCRLYFANPSLISSLMATISLHRTVSRASRSASVISCNRMSPTVFATRID